MNNTKEIEITVKNSKLFAQKNSFNKRWNIIDNEENKEQFKDRCLAILDTEFYRHSPDNRVFNEKVSYINDYCLEIARDLGLTIKANNFDNFANKNLYTYIKCLDINYIEDYRNFMFFLQLTLNYDYKGYILNENIATSFAEAMKLCNIKAKILKDNGVF